MKIRLSGYLLSALFIISFASGSIGDNYIKISSESDSTDENVRMTIEMARAVSTAIEDISTNSKGNNDIFSQFRGIKAGIKNDVFFVYFLPNIDEQGWPKGMNIIYDIDRENFSIISSSLRRR